MELPFVSDMLSEELCIGAFCIGAAERENLLAGGFRGLSIELLLLFRFLRFGSWNLMPPAPGDSVDSCNKMDQYTDVLQGNWQET